MSKPQTCMQTLFNVNCLEGQARESGAHPTSVRGSVYTIVFYYQFVLGGRELCVKLSFGTWP